MPAATCACPNSVYKNYPRLRVALSHLKRVYNAHIELVEQLEAAGQVLVICPENPLEVNRFGTRIDQLEALYEEGICLRRTHFLTTAHPAFSRRRIKLWCFTGTPQLSRETRLVFFDFAPLFVKTFGEGGAKFFCLD